jgi:GNAT superfamily N-acetyltransferase
MTVTIAELAPPPDAAYAAVSIAFEVREVFDVQTSADGVLGLAPAPRSLTPAYIKDYDLEPGGHPTDWARRFNTRHWGVLQASLDGRHIGGAVLAWNTPEVDLLDGRTDLVNLWDIRVAPPARGRGVGPALFHAAERWARARGARELKVETQNINVAGCRFYRRLGCELRTVRPLAYPELPEEVQLLWYKRLG